MTQEKIAEFENWLMEEKNVSFSDAAQAGRYLDEFFEEDNS